MTVSTFIGHIGKSSSINKFGQMMCRWRDAATKPQKFADSKLSRCLLGSVLQLASVGKRPKLIAVIFLAPKTDNCCNTPVDAWS
jgi:hypothetical protein